ncbi:MAG: carboxyl transferase domain-containing protein [Candidatus Bathyarchaeota archaeon]
MSDMNKKIEELEQKLKQAYLGGGNEAIERQHKSGKLTARERLEKLLDPGSFTELGTFALHQCTDLGMDKKKIYGDAVVTGYGTIDGRLVYVFSQDFTFIGGSLGLMHAKKICNIMDLALKMGAPVLGINDSGGARIQEGIDALRGYGDIFFRNTLSSGIIPQISVIAGPCAGGAVYSPALCDFVIMIDKTSYMFITGPAVIKEVTGEEVGHDQLGGAMTHNQTSGNAHLFARNEEECTQLTKKLLSYLPSNHLDDPPILKVEGSDELLDDPKLNDIIPVDSHTGYDVLDVINTVVDKETFFEIHQFYAQNAVVGFARLRGRSVGIIANQPRVAAGCLDINASDKIARFVRFCDAFNIPLITFMDTPGYLPGTGQEYGGIIRHGAKILHAYSEATVPKVTIVLRKGYGGAYIAMCSKHLGADIVYALPTSELAVMGPEGAVAIIFKRDIDAAGEKASEVRSKRIKEYREKFANPYVAASRGYVDEVIRPVEIRPKVINALETILTKREAVLRPPKKHGNIPL